MSTKVILITAGIVIVGLLSWGTWTELKIWWKTRELKDVQAKTQQFQQELETAKAQREADLAQVRKNQEHVQALTRQIKAVVAAADRDREARERLERQAAAREPEITRLRDLVAKLEVERRTLKPVSNLHEGVLELRKRGY